MSDANQTADLVIGWRAISEALGRPVQTLANACSQGRLPVQPMKLGTTVAMTPQMIEVLRSAAPMRAKA